MSLRTSHTQFTILVEFMEKNGDLSKPQNLPQGRQWCIKKWKELSDLLNSQGIGESRSEEKWRKVWSDLKNNTKRKWAKINRTAHGTGGGPALKMCLTDLENRVLSIMGVEAAIGMSIAEVGFSKVEESGEVNKPAEPNTEDLIIVPPEIHAIDDEDWNTPGCSKDPVIIPPTNHRSLTPPRSPTPPKTATPPKSPTFHRQPTLQPSIQRRQPKKKPLKLLEDYFILCEENIRNDNRERERMFVELERERIRQRDIELRQSDTGLQLQVQWLEFMQRALDMLEKYLSDRK